VVVAEAGENRISDLLSFSSSAHSGMPVLDLKKKIFCSCVAVCLNACL